MKNIKLGSFLVSENKIVVTDPSYNYGDFGTLILDDVLEGKYFAVITTTDNLIASLNIIHSDYKNIAQNFSLYGEIFVDSGQAGFFDERYFKENQGGTFGDTNSFYGLACATTMSPIAIYKKANNNGKTKTSQNNLKYKHKIKLCRLPPVKILFPEFSTYANKISFSTTSSQSDSSRDCMTVNI